MFTHYSSPISDVELRSKWELAIFGRKIGQSFRLCHLHFNEEDLAKTSKGIVLKRCAIPIPITVPKTENVENMDDESIEG